MMTKTQVSNIISCRSLWGIACSAWEFIHLSSGLGIPPIGSTTAQLIICPSHLSACLIIHPSDLQTNHLSASAHASSFLPWIYNQSVVHLSSSLIILSSDLQPTICPQQLKPLHSSFRSTTNQLSSSAHASAVLPQIDLQLISCPPQLTPLQSSLRSTTNKLSTPAHTSAVLPQIYN